MPDRLERDFYLRKETLDVARDLLGKLLVVASEKGERVSGMIVEVEAYLGERDKAAHSYGGRRTKRTEVAFGPGGFAYVFFVYGMYHQFNVVTGPRDWPHVILIRALQPFENLDVMKDNRPVKDPLNLTSGPGKLCIALGIDKTYYGEDLTGEKIWIEDGDSPDPADVSSGPRVGIDYAGEYISKPWRFWLKNNPHVSRTPRRKK